MPDKLVPTDKITALIKSLKKKGKSVVFTNGCFDLIHPGHIKLLKQAKKYGDILFLGINSDKSIKKIKGLSRPVMKEKERITVLSAIEYIDLIAVFNEPTPIKVIEKIRPDALVKGSDWPKSEIVGKEFVESYGGKVFTVKLKPGISTSSLIKRILDNG